MKKLTDAVIQNEIGRIFRGHNIIEYKSPEDNLSIDDFYKTLGYACIYKGLGKTVDEVPAGELTVSLFRERFPHKMTAALRQSGMAVEERFQGVYYVSGQIPFPTQIVVTGRLAATHHSLRILSKNADENDVKAFLEEAVRLPDPGDRDNISAVLEVSTAANLQLFEELRRRTGMCDALRELMRADLVNERLEGIDEGVRKTNLKALTHVMNSFSVDAEKAMDILQIPGEEREIYRSKLLEVPENEIFPCEGRL